MKSMVGGGKGKLHDRVIVETKSHKPGRNGSILVRIKHFQDQEEIVVGSFHDQAFEVRAGESINFLPGQRRFVHGDIFLPRRQASRIPLEEFERAPR